MKNAERYPEYLAAARPAFEKYGARFLVRGGRFEAMEGSPRERNVVVEFDDYATALACYRSPEYQAAKALRNAYADSDFVIVEGAWKVGLTLARSSGPSLLSWSVMPRAMLSTLPCRAEPSMRWMSTVDPALICGILVSSK